MNLRRRSYLAEATYGKDRKIRDMAVGFYKSLIDFVEKHPEGLRKRANGEFYLFSSEFWNRSIGDDIVVIFTPSGHGVHGGVGKVKAGGKKLKVMTLASLKGPGNPKHLHSRINRRTVVHEFAHLMDPGMEVGGTTQASAMSNLASYYNNPSEWNSFWQDGAQALENAAETWDLNNPKLKKAFFGSGSLKELHDRAHRYWDNSFLKAMSKKTSRKFDKRLAQLWQSLKKRGLL